jgi:hypothetical protein
MLLNFSRCLSILLLQASKTDNNALDIDAIYNLKLRKTLPNSTDSFTTKLNTKFQWPLIMPTQRECILQGFIRIRGNKQNIIQFAPKLIDLDLNPY